MHQSAVVGDQVWVGMNLFSATRNLVLCFSHHSMVRDVRQVEKSAIKYTLTDKILVSEDEMYPILGFPIR